MSGDGFELDVLAPSASILPIRTHSERDLDKEMEAVGHALRSTDAAGAAIDWTKRLGALRRLQGLVLGGAANVGADAPSALLASLKPLREAMSAQLSDLRSQIIREACVTLKLLAGALGEAFAEHVDFFFDKLLRQTGVTILIISRSAHACMCELIARTRPVRSAPRVAAALADRSTAVRIRAIEYFELLARVIPPPAVEGERGPLDRHADILLAALRPALRDAVAEVRAIARAAFWALHAHLPAQCRALLESSDAQTQRLLRDEEASAAADRRQPAAHASRASAESAREGSGGGGASGGGELHANPASKPRADGGAAVRHLAHAARAGHAEHAPAARPGAARGTGAAATAADGRRKRDAAGEAGAPAGGGGLGGAIRVAPPAARGGGTAAERELPLGGLTRRPPSAASGARRVVVALAAPTAPARDAASDRQAHAAPPVPSGGALPKPACRALAPELDAQLQSMDVGSCAASVAPPPSHPPPAAALAHAPPPSPPAAHASQAQPAGASAARVANELSQSPQEPAMPQEPQLAAPPPQLKPAPPPALQQQPGTPPKRQPHKPTTPGRSPRAAVGAAAAAVVSADQGLSSVWIGQMPSLLRQLGSGQPPSAQREALLNIQKMTAQLAGSDDDPVWRKHFEHILEAELRLLESEDGGTREAALQAMRELLRSQRARVVQFTEHILLRLLAAHRDCAREVGLVADACLCELVGAAADPRRCLAVLIPAVAREHAPVLQASIRLISRIVPVMRAADLELLLPQLLPPLYDAFKSPCADVRKAVTFALVQMHGVLGESLAPHLAELSSSQLKLVMIYINRTGGKTRDDSAGR